MTVTSVSRKLNCTAANHICIFTHIANWWAWELVPSEVGGGPVQISGTAGRFYGNPVSGNQQSSHWSNFSGETYLTQYLPWTTSCEGWELRAGCWTGKKGWEKQWSTSSTEQANCRYGDHSSDPSKVVIHKDQHRRQLKLWWLDLTCKHMVRKALGANPQITETTGHIGSRLTQPKLHPATLLPTRNMNGTTHSLGIFALFQETNRHYYFFTLKSLHFFKKQTTIIIFVI